MRFLKQAKGRALFAAVVAAPGDDRPRRQLAAWLKERADPLGRFIELQLARKPGSRNLKEQAALRRDHEAAWLGPIHEVVDGSALEFSRGFLTSLRVENTFFHWHQFVGAMAAATGHPALSLVTRVELARHVGIGAPYNERGRIFARPKKGEPIALVVFLADAVFDRLVTLEGELGREVEAALRLKRPALFE